ncbi:MAG: prepilin-type N-terminal cleavage/methylation domain-containing protein [Patescibacteria group bacterium]|nr:prepilin-type N-terminal cleavage/methylation domain-containing protein [Patescibacteria group bacterium]MCL5262069.1 prepilin-type N-terminal cleavage/methylation domain-containing protein [Patescibacteria group bacterium]
MVISDFLISFRKSANCHRGRISGFTLVEMVVTIGIVSLLLTSMSISGASIRREFALAKAQEELRSLITYARFLSVATLADPGGALVCGYGVHILTNPGAGNPNAYIFRDSGDGEICSGINETDNLKDQGTLYSMTLDPLILLDSPDQIIEFIPPDPTVVFDPGADPDGGVTIVVQSRSGSGHSRQVKVLASGMVSIAR